MYQQAVLEKKPVAGMMRARRARIKALVHELEEANKDPEFRKAAKEFIKYHT